MASLVGPNVTVNSKYAEVALNFSTRYCTHSAEYDMGVYLPMWNFTSPIDLQFERNSNDRSVLQVIIFESFLFFSESTNRETLVNSRSFQGFFLASCSFQPIQMEVRKCVLEYSDGHLKIV